MQDEMEKDLEALFEQIIKEELDKNDLSSMPERIGDAE